MRPEYQKLNRGHRRLALDCNLDSKIVWLNPKLTGSGR